MFSIRNSLIAASGFTVFALVAMFSFAVAGAEYEDGRPKPVSSVIRDAGYKATDFIQSGLSPIADLFIGE